MSRHRLLQIGEQATHKAEYYSVTTKQWHKIPEFLIGATVGPLEVGLFRVCEEKESTE